MLYPTRSINLCASFFILAILSETSSGAHYQYESCVPGICSNGLNVTFPFYIIGPQESYCGYPGFGINCSQNGFPVLQLPGAGAKYVVEHIFYHNRSIRVYDSAVSGLSIDYVNGSWDVNGSFSSEDGGCLPIIRNSTLPTRQFQSANFIPRLHLISNCTASLSNATRLASTVICNTTRRPLAIYGDQNIEYLRDALENCAGHVVAPVEDVERVDVALRRGVLLNWTASDCGPCENSGGRCGFDNAAYRFRCFCPDGPHSNRCIPIAEKAHFTLPFVIGFTVPMTIVAAVLVIFIFIRRKNIMRNKTKTQMEIELFLRNHENLAPKRYEYKKLKKITNSFGDSIGKGGYGSVYRGMLEDGRVVAVKILNKSKGNGEDFMNEVASISTTSHVNIVSLLGFCADGKRRALIYEFMPNGSLEEFIHNSEEDQGRMRTMFQIAVGSSGARVLASRVQYADIAFRHKTTQHSFG